MAKIKGLIILIVLFNVQKIFTQSVELVGKVESKTDVENIHVINKTSKFLQ